VIVSRHHHHHHSIFIIISGANLAGILGERAVDPEILEMACFGAF